MRAHAQALALVLLLAPAELSAQEHGEVTLADVLAMARDRSPASRALRARVTVAEAAIDLAGVYPNPELGYVVMGRFDGGPEAINGSQHQLWIDFPILFGSQHEARRDVAAAEAEATRADTDADLLALEALARRAFVVLLAAQERERRLLVARDEIATLGVFVERRTDAGAESTYDAARFRLELARTEGALASAHAEVRAASAALASVLGRPGWSPTARGDLERMPASTADVDTSPLIRAARLRVEAAERDVQRAERERIPEVRVGVGAYLTSDPDSSSLYGGLSMPLPIFDTGDAAVGRARAAQMAAEAERDAVEMGVAARIAGALETMEARRAALRAFDEGVRPIAPGITEMAAAAYRLGRSGAFEVLDAFRSSLEVDLARLDLIEAILDAEAELLELVGGRTR